ncbi:MAG: hypothetical protein ACHQZQ_01665 [SAR324 cluster bacterium]
MTWKSVAMREIRAPGPKEATRRRHPDRVLAALLVSAVTLAACSEPEPYKPTFFGRTEGVREPASQPEGLNPLGDIDTCGDKPQLDPGEERVLVARPNLFTREASIMISSLRQAVADNYHGRRPVRFMVTGRRVQTDGEAVAEGGRCAALIVLWEVYGSRALELTVPAPARIPLKAQIQPRLCEFGNYSEQLQILYLTITGLLAVLDDDYETANANMDLATRIDSHCLQLPTQLPGGGTGAPPRGGPSPAFAK